jgi:hypothetical protein
MKINSRFNSSGSDCMRSSLLVIFLLSACALRPRYQDFVKQLSAEKEISLQMMGENNAAVVGAKVEMSDGKNKFSQSTDANGMIRLPIEKKYFDENPVLVVTLPMAVTEYRLTAARLVVPAAPVVAAPVVAEPVVQVAPLNETSAVDAGTP